MKGVGIFLNTRIEEVGGDGVLNLGVLANVADSCLAPVRYMCNGHTVRVLHANQHLDGYVVDHVESFHARGVNNVSRTNPRLRSSETGMLKTIFAIILFVPGLFLGAILKTAAFLSSPEMRAQHDLAKYHYTPLPQRVIGSLNAPITDEAELIGALGGEYGRTQINQPTESLIIYCQEGLQINYDNDNLLRFNPMRVILIGGWVFRNEVDNRSLWSQMNASGKWAFKILDQSPDENINQIIQRAKQVPLPRRGWFTCKRMHSVFQVNVRPENPAPQAGAEVAAANA